MQKVRQVFFSAARYDSEDKELPPIYLEDGQKQTHLANWIDEECTGEVPDHSFSLIGWLHGKKDDGLFVPEGEGNLKISYLTLV